MILLFITVFGRFAFGPEPAHLRIKAGDELDEVEHDSENFQGRGLCYLTKPKAVGTDNTNQGLDNSRSHAKTESNNCFIRHFKY